MGLVKFKGEIPVLQDVVIAKNEYRKYQAKTISPVEKTYLETLKEISNKINDKVDGE